MWSIILFVLPSIIDMTPVTEPVTYILFVVGLTPIPLLPQSQQPFRVYVERGGRLVYTDIALR